MAECHEVRELRGGVRAPIDEAGEVQDEAVLGEALHDAVLGEAGEVLREAVLGGALHEPSWGNALDAPVDPASREFARAGRARRRGRRRGR
eukprot:15461191-Alexandrium_andersonii.AAC.1